MFTAYPPPSRELLGYSNWRPTKPQPPTFLQCRWRDSHSAYPSHPPTSDCCAIESPERAIAQASTTHLPASKGLAESGATSPKERGPIETQPGRKAETDRVFEGISEGFRLAESERVAPGGEDAVAFCQAPPSLAGPSPHPMPVPPSPHPSRVSFTL